MHFNNNITVHQLQLCKTGTIWIINSLSDIDYKQCTLEKRAVFISSGRYFIVTTSSPTLRSTHNSNRCERGFFTG